MSIKHSDNIAIRLSGIQKKYVLHHQKPTLVENIIHLGKKEELWALKNINLEIKKGEKYGVIGLNGSGKTTLLKIISGITSPTTGRVDVDGRIATLIDLDAGFHPELTGEENIYLNGMLLGMGKKEIKSKFTNIIDFSGLKRVIDTPFYTYSSGMKLRLGFSLVISSEPKILLIDEFFSVGDKNFQDKSQQVINQLLKRGTTLLFCSHSLNLVSRICQKAIWLEKGSVKYNGPVDETIGRYQRSLC